MDISFFLDVETKSVSYTSSSSSMETAVVLVGVFEIDEAEQQSIRATFFQDANDFGRAVFHVAYDVGIPSIVREVWPVSDFFTGEEFSMEREAQYGGRAQLRRDPSSGSEVIVVETVVDLSQTVPFPNLTIGDMTIIAADLLALIFAQTVLEFMFIRYFGMRIDVKFIGFDEESEPSFSFVPASSDEEK